jgi:hypothetical protein
MCLVCIFYPPFWHHPILTLGLLLHPVLALDKFIPNVAPCINGTPSAGIGCPVPELGA